MNGLRNLLDRLRLANPVAWFAAALSSLVTSALLLLSVPSWLVRGVAAGVLLAAYGWRLQTRRVARRYDYRATQHGPGRCVDGANCPLQ